MSVSDFDPEAGTPEYLYMKLATHITDLIGRNVLKPGTRLPGERDFAEQFGVSIGTARRTIQVLRQRGLITTLPAKGNYIAIRDDERPTDGDTDPGESR